jgi:hypothetical protein
MALCHPLKFDRHMARMKENRKKENRERDREKERERSR